MSDGVKSSSHLGSGSGTHMNRFARGLSITVGLALSATLQKAQAVTIDTVTVGNPGNAGDVQSQGTFGAVGYNYRIGKTEVTNAQYVEFLNGVDPTGTNTLALYNGSMSSDANGGINFNSGAADGSKYEIKSGRDNNPVVFVSWYDSIRFANWLHNGQGTGDTENGAYTLGALGAGGVPTGGNSITRNAGALWFLPSEDEWYKASYHKNDGATGNYWDFPTSTDAVPYSDQPPGTGAPDSSNTANFFKDDGTADGYDDGYAVTGSTSFVSSQNYLTDVGAYTSSDSPYGTFDQGGNVWEWNEALMSSSLRGVRGGSWNGSSIGLHTFGSVHRPPGGHDDVGFRVASNIPEPSTLLLLCFGSLAALWRRRGLICVCILAAAISVTFVDNAHADSAVAWGSNGYGQLGDGTTTNHNTPMPVSGMDSGVTAIAAGANHSLAVQNGAVYAWGYNVRGELGDGTTTNRLTPVPVIGLASGVTAIGASGIPIGTGYSLAIQNGGLFAWGRNGEGQLGDGTFIRRLTPVAVSGMDSGVTAISAGAQHSLAVKDGGLYAWGANSSGELGNGTLPTCDPCVNFVFPTPAAVIGLSSGVTAISAGRSHSLAVKDGRVYSWGSNVYGELGPVSSGGLYNPTPELVAGLESGATAVAAGSEFSLAVVNGSAYYWGRYSPTPVQVDPTNLSNIVAVAASNCCASYALSSDGRLWSGLSGPTPQELLPPAGHKFTSIDAVPSGGHVVATLAAVPEPSTLLLLCFGSLAVLWRRRGLVCGAVL